jgi:hypothetical protein
MPTKDIVIIIAWIQIYNTYLALTKIYFFVPSDACGESTWVAFDIWTAENKTMELFAEGLRFCMNDRLALEAVTLFDMPADDTVIEFPFAPAGSTKRLDGKEAIRSYRAGIGIL